MGDTAADYAAMYLLEAAVSIAKRLRAVSPEEAEMAALDVGETRQRLGKSPRDEARVISGVLSAVEDVLRGGDFP